jgi:tetratricopeptide (TPR) repeat protein
MRQAVICAACGSKIRAERGKCPRCGAALVAPDPAAAAAASKRLRNIAGGLGAAFLVVAAVLWIRSEPAPRTPASVRTDDPLAARRAAPKPAATPGAAPVAERAFLDPAASGSLAYAGGDFEAALAQYQAAIARNPEDAESFSNLGQVLVKLNRPAEAIPHLQRAAEILPSRWAYQFNLARAYGLLGQWEPAVAGYRRAQTLFPNDYATAFNLGQALHKQGDEVGAVEAYQQAIAIEPNDPSFRMALGISYERLQKRTEAAAAYSEALRLSPDAPDADTVRARIAQLTAPGGTAQSPGARQAAGPGGS